MDHRPERPAASQRKKKSRERAFYEPPEEGVQSSIIADARREVARPIHTHRPFTPAQRNLFARRSASGKARPPSSVSIASELLPDEVEPRRGFLPPLDIAQSITGCAKPPSRQGLPRVSSATPQNSFADLQTVGAVTPEELTGAANRVAHGGGGGPQPQAPSGPKPAHTARRYPRSSSSRSRPASGAVADSLLRDPRPSPEPANSKPAHQKVHGAMSKQGIGNHTDEQLAASQTLDRVQQDCESPKTSAKQDASIMPDPTPPQKIERTPGKQEQSDSEAVQAVKDTGKPEARDARGITAAEAPSEQPPSNGKSKCTMEEQAESQQWLDAQRVLQDIDAARKERAVNLDKVCDLTRALYGRLREIITSGKVPEEETLRNRKKVLSTGFRLLPLKHAQTSVQVAKIAFELRVSGANLRNLVKTIFSVAHTPGNDAVFADEQLLGHLKRTLLASTSDGVTSDSAVYAGGVLKLASNNTVVAELVGTEEFVLQMSRFLRTSMQSLTTPALKAKLSEKDIMDMGSRHVQMTGILRNLAEHREIHTFFLKHHISKLLFPFLSCMPQEKELIFNIVRVYSYLTQDARFQEVLAAEGGSSTQFLQLIQRCLAAAPKLDTDLLIRLWFIIGNLEEGDDAFRATVVPDKDAVDGLVALVSHTADIFSATPLAGESGLTDEGQDILSKAIRVLVNLCPSQSVGPMLVSNNALFQLIVRMFEHKHISNSPGVMKVVMALLGNLSFYVVTTSVLLREQNKVLQLIAPYISLENVDIGRVAAHVLSNLTRSKEGRVFVEQNGLLDTVISVLADASDADMVYYLLGSLVNLSSEVSLRSQLRSAKTITWLINAVKYYGPSDWEIASISCQVLWNCCNEIQESEDKQHALGQKSAMHIVSVLETYTDSCPFPEDLDDCDADEKERLEEAWKTHFVPVAHMLLPLVQSHISCWEPLKEEDDADARDDSH
ncbi:armadillo repeat-containing protein 2-like [Sycon ciliatum]|uniref:armadillo repeat-containing protein 2-like n=1 Tax=Sycon ciliatum TaxID=27933 RepID=UPI0031F6A075